MYRSHCVPTARISKRPCRRLNWAPSPAWPCSQGALGKAKVHSIEGPRVTQVPSITMNRGLGGQGQTCCSRRPVACVRPMLILSLCFEGLVLELQRARILRHGAYHMIRHAARNICLDLEDHINLCTNQPGQMGDYFVRNAASIPANPSWFKDHSPVESPG